VSRTSCAPCRKLAQVYQELEGFVYTRREDGKVYVVKTVYFDQMPGGLVAVLENTETKRIFPRPVPVADVFAVKEELAREKAGVLPTEPPPSAPEAPATPIPPPVGQASAADLPGQPGDEGSSAAAAHKGPVQRAGWEDQLGLSPEALLTSSPEVEEVARSSPIDLTNSPGDDSTGAARPEDNTAISGDSEGQPRTLPAARGSGISLLLSVGRAASEPAPSAPQPRKMQQSDLISL
jgi:hypothetical protein